jgi:hypothetical protein
MVDGVTCTPTTYGKTIVMLADNFKEKFMQLKKTINCEIKDLTWKGITLQHVGKAFEKSKHSKHFLKIKLVEMLNLTRQKFLKILSFKLGL